MQAMFNGEPPAMPQPPMQPMVFVPGNFIPPPMRPAKNYEDEYDPEVDNIDDIIHAQDPFGHDTEEES